MLHDFTTTTVGPNVNNLVPVKRLLPIQPNYTKLLNFCILNAGSINNKTLIIKDYVVEKKIDILALTETWLKPDDDSDYITRDITPLGYCFAHTPRSSGNGGGVAFLYRKDLKMERLKNPVFKSFECMESLLNTTSCVLRIIVVYRPPGSTQNGSTTALFFDEFSTMLERLVSLPGKLLVTSDFNFHINNPFDNTARQFLDLLNCINLHVLNTVSLTHKNNNILDLIIARTDELTALNPFVNDPVISDHFAVHCNLPISKPQNHKMVSTTRSLHNINLQSFVQDITSSTLFNSPSSDLTELCDQYNSDLSTILDKHAPLRTKIITIRPKAPWYNNYIREQKTICRRLERSWRHSHTETDHQAYINQCTVVKQSIYTSKMNYYSDLINEAGVDSKALFRNVDRLLHRKAEKFLPTCSSAAALANNFAEFFETKIIEIKLKFT
ncbi:uncharacterized protein [Montipora foliosa]|uniref:uncharacterized protein n=1 Tax=Montipora foliosa TaxID=591990 RepID=UPI0035F19B0A